MSRTIDLIAVDLDGTLIGPVNEFYLYPSFRDKLKELRGNGLRVWLVCTGRPFRGFKEVFTPMSMMGLEPDYVIVSHAYIFERTRFGFIPHLFWNLRIFFLQWLGQLYAREAVSEWHKMVVITTPKVKTLSKRRGSLRVSFESEESAILAAGVLREKINNFRHLRIFRYRNEVDVRSVPFTKGLAVSELCSHLGVQPENVLSIGNGHNDLSMLSSKVSGMSGCTANSDPELTEFIHDQGGHVSRKKSLAGVIDVLDAYIHDKVDSSLPDGWVYSTEAENPIPHRPRRPHKKKKYEPLTVLVLTMAVYSVLMVFANYNLIPFVSKYILLPIKIATKIFEKLLTLV